MKNEIYRLTTGFGKMLVITIIVLTSAGMVTAQDLTDSLVQGFKNPPQSAKPRTFWHWTGGNITKTGITKDLEWMKRVGIGGVQLGDLSVGWGQTIKKKVLFGTPEWLDDVRYAASQAKRLGLEMSIFSSAGWSEAGGPWVKPKEAMKKLVWVDTTLEGPQTFDARLPHPPDNNGPFQNLSTGGHRRKSSPDPTFYGDAAVIAYPTPPASSDMRNPHPQVTTNAGRIDGSALLDDDLNSAVTITAPKGGKPAWVQLSFTRPFHARAISIVVRGGMPFGRILAGVDGTHFQTLAVLPGPQEYRGGSVCTYSFPETTARYFRVEITGASMTPAEVIAQPHPQPDSVYTLAEIRLHSQAYVNRWEDKASFGSFLYDYRSSRTPPYRSSAEIQQSEVIDLTSKMDSDGTLHWKIPKGRWTILRLGYSLTGAKNRPAMPTGLGYEVDKLNPEYVKNYLHGYLDPIAKTLGPLFGKCLSYMTLDSWEAGTQNWTAGMIDAFRKRRGYDPTPYLPVLTGRVVQNSEISDRFLWDFRRTLADMFAENFYGTVTNFLHKRGIGTYGEASGVSLVIPEDALLNKKNVDIPMGEFWVHHLHPKSMYYVDVRGAASASHTYGKPYVAAESFTGGGYQAPYTLKGIADYWFAQGVNRIVLHNSALQPLDTKPGNTMVGTNFNRNITWANEAKPFMTYLARNSFMLQQGQFVADLAYLLKEGAPSSMPFWGGGLQPKPPKGYDYDYVNTDVLLNLMSVNPDGSIVLPDGMHYRVLVLPEIDRMTLPVLHKIREMVKAGATVVGPKPVKSPGLRGYPDVDHKIQAIADQVWGDLDGVSRNINYYGKGMVVWGLPLTKVLSMLNVPKDVAFSRPLDSKFAWIHRRKGNTDIYFVTNLTDHPQNIKARFRVSGKKAELWHPDTGTIEAAGYRISDGFTTVPLHLGRHGSVFVVFRERASSPVRIMPPATSTVTATVKGPWTIHFPPDLGAPAEIRIPKLESWTKSADKGVKYFSGTAAYTNTIRASKSWFHHGTKILLDLGKVRDLAQVSVNGKPLGILWKSPWQMNITDVLKPGINRLKIEVTNEWTNRLSGDRRVPKNERILSSGAPRFGRRQPLSESGLLGPVKVISVTPDKTNNKQ